jgi:3-oxoadipate enol-lactonase
MTQVQDDRKPFHVDVSGASPAPTLLFSNSLTCDLAMWDAQVEALSGRFRIVRLRRAGTRLQHGHAGAL